MTTTTFKTRTPKVVVSTVEVTPEMAADWLGKNSHNRPIRNSTVDRLTKAIQRDEWVLNGDAIRFSVTDVLLDGQHRLWAIVTAETPVLTVVITGLPNEAQETMDVGARRNLKDALSLRGYRDAAALAAAISYLWKQETGATRSNLTPTIQQAIALFEEHPGIRDSAIAVRSHRRRFRIAGSMLAVFHYTASTIDTEAADLFLQRLYEGVDLQMGDPILVLRHQIEAQAVAGFGARSSSLAMHALFIKAWNAWREGRKIDRLSWKSGGTNAEKFPEMHS